MLSFPYLLYRVCYVKDIGFFRHPSTHPLSLPIKVHLHLDGIISLRLPSDSAFGYRIRFVTGVLQRVL